MNRKKARSSDKDATWPPAGVSDLKPDIQVSDKPDAMRFPTLRNAIVKRTSTITPDKLTEQLVLDTLHRSRRDTEYLFHRSISPRDAEYLCRAYLQFGRAAMAPNNLLRLCEIVNRLKQ